MDRIESMSVIVAIAEAGSLSAASRQLRIPIPTVSRRLSELETRLKTQLFQRSPRHLTLTDAGRSYIEACKRIIEQVNDAEQEASGEYRTPTGDLAVTSPWGLGHLHLLAAAEHSPAVVARRTMPEGQSRQDFLPGVIPSDGSAEIERERMTFDDVKFNRWPLTQEALEAYA